MNEIEKLEALKNDQEFVKKLGLAGSDEEIQALLEGKGIHLTLEELKTARSEGGELSEEALENVAGGFAEIVAGAAIICAIIGFYRGARCKP